jgi:predicted cytidylate kinase
MVAGKKKQKDMSGMQRITISGLPGSGKTTVSMHLSRSLGIPVFSAGKIFREEASKLNMPLNEFSKYCEKNPEIDQKLDRMQLEILRKGGLILESRLGGWLSFKEGLPAFKVWLDASVEKRISRVAARDNLDRDQSEKLIKQRERSEEMRYKLFYGFDIRDLSIYDLKINTDNLSPEETCNLILQRINEK